jgi:hypothetical protein
VSSLLPNTEELVETLFQFMNAQYT